MLTISSGTPPRAARPSTASPGAGLPTAGAARRFHSPPDPVAWPGCLSLAHVQSHTGELVPTNRKVTGSCFVFQRGDVLFARLGAYLNKVHAAESDGGCSPEFHV